jgi:hypothetical protein
MSRLVIGSRAELVGALRAQLRANGPAPCHDGGCRCVAAALKEQIRALLQDMFLDALFLVAQFPGGQIAEADKCCYAFDVRACAGLNCATWAEEAFWSGLVRVRAGPEKRTRLMYAAAHGDAARVTWLLARGAPREAKGVNGWTALHYASCIGRADAVRALLAAGANADAVQNNGATPLHFAAKNGSTDAVRVLLAAGASVEAAANNGWRALHVASALGQLDVMRILADAGVNTSALTNNGRSAADVCCTRIVDLKKHALAVLNRAAP